MLTVLYTNLALYSTPVNRPLTLVNLQDKILHETNCPSNSPELYSGN